jgi:hypothetical protein
MSKIVNWDDIEEVNLENVIDKVTSVKKRCEVIINDAQTIIDFEHGRINNKTFLDKMVKDKKAELVKQAEKAISDYWRTA